MFTGLIQTTGTVLSLKPSRASTRLIIAAPALAGMWQVGDSIAVNGVCLTAVAVEGEDQPHPGRFAADLAEETIRRTTLSRLQPGAVVNLELPALAGSRLGGHVVQGHVDTTGKLLSIVPLHPDLDRTDWRLTVEVPASLAASLIPQGSITLDGISLTIAAAHESDAGIQIEIAVIPHTYRATNLHSLLSGAELNIETDVLSKYAARRAAFGSDAADTAFQSIWTAPPIAGPQLVASPASHPLTQPVAQPDPLPARPMLVHSAAAAAPSTDPKREWLTAEYLMANGY